MIRRLALVVLLTVLAVPAVACAAFPGQNGKILFQDAVDIRVVNPDGTGNTALTNESGPYNNTPEWSADGRKIVFSHVDDNLEEYPTEVMNADGSGRNVVFFESASSPSWSPDGHRIALARTNIWTIPYTPDAGPPERLENNPAVSDRQPEWSPEGSRIAFVSNRDGNNEIYTMNASDGSGLVRLTNHAADDGWPEWSPDGSRLVFSSNRDENYEIYTMNASDGGAVTRLTNDPLTDTTPAWSPDGRKIVWERFFPERLWVMNADGSGQQNLGVDGAAPDWQPILHDAPQSAGTLEVSLVPMFRQTISDFQCRARGGQNSAHGAPLAFSSCNPPGYLPNTMAHIGPSSFSSFLRVSVVPGDPATVTDEADLSFGVSATDVRSSSTGFDYDPSPNPDATLSLLVRWSDTYNAPTLRAPATTSDFTYSLPVNCVTTADPAVGASCVANTSADALAPGTILEGRHTVMTLGRFWLHDSGLNATRGDGDDRQFAQSGIYVP